MLTRQTSKFFTACLAMAALLVSVSVGTAGTNSFPYVEDFESYTNGQFLAIETNGWYGAVDAIVAEDYTYPPFTPSAGFPMTGSTHDVIMSLQSDATNYIDGSTRVALTNYIDMLVKPRFFSVDDVAPTNVPTDTQMGWFVDADGHVNLYHLNGGNVTNTLSFTNNVGMWSVATNVVVPQDEWIRVTIELAYDDNIDFTSYYYRMKINGMLLMNEYAHYDPSFLAMDYFAEGVNDDGAYGSLFAMATSATPAQNHVNAISLRGTGKFDDITITETEPPPITNTTAYVITATASTSGGSISPSGSVYVLEGADQTFTVTTNMGYSIDGIVVVENGTNKVISGSAYTFTNVIADGSITVSFLSEAGGAGEPDNEWYLATGRNSSELDSSFRSDNMTVGQAWLASVDPNSTNVDFRVVDVWQTGGTNYVEWHSIYVDTNLPPFGIYARTNLMDTTYMWIDTHPREAAPTTNGIVTNVWQEAAPAYPIYYRVLATNAPAGP